MERLTWITGQTREEVAMDLLRTGDEFELRIVDETTVAGRLPVLRAPGVVEGFVQVLRS